MARLTKNSFRFNFNDYFNFKNFFFNSNNIMGILNFNEINANFHEDSYYLIFKNKKTPLISLFHSYPNLRFNKINKISTFFNKYTLNNNNKNYYNLFRKVNIFNKFEIIILFFFNPFFMKYFFFTINTLNKKNVSNNKISNFLNVFKDFFFYSKKNFFFLNNLIPNTNFTYTIKKKMLKIFNYSKFPTITTM
jgi:hypothetical protein